MEEVSENDEVGGKVHTGAVMLGGVLHCMLRAIDAFAAGGYTEQADYLKAVDLELKRSLQPVIALISEELDIPELRGGVQEEQIEESQETEDSQE